MKTSSSVGFPSETASIRSGKACTSFGISSWPFACVSRTRPSKASAFRPRRAPISAASFSGSARVQREDVPADLRLELRRRAERDETAAVEDRDPVALLRLLHEMRREEARHAVRVADPREVGAEVATPARVEPRRGLVEEQQPRPMEHPLRELDAPPHPARELFDAIPGAVREPDPLRASPAPARASPGT